MKNSIKCFLLISFLLMEVFSVMIFAVGTVNALPPAPGLILKKKPFATICIVIARHRDCEGFGICRLSINLRSAPSNSATATIYMDDLNKNMIFEIDRAKGITDQNYNKYFASGSFVMEDDCPLTSEITTALGIPGNKTLAAGQYRVTEKDGKLFMSLIVK